MRGALIGKERKILTHRRDCVSGAVKAAASGSRANRRNDNLKRAESGWISTPILVRRSLMTSTNPRGILAESSLQRDNALTHHVAPISGNAPANLADAKQRPDKCRLDPPGISLVRYDDNVERYNDNVTGYDLVTPCYADNSVSRVRARNYRQGERNKTTTMNYPRSVITIQRR